MKLTMAFLFTVLFSLISFAGFKGLDGTTEIGVFNSFKCGVGTTCTQSGKSFQVATGTQDQVSVTGSADSTAAQCGSTFINSAATTLTLPEASTVLGCRMTFVVGNASNFDIDPEAGDQILRLTNASGDKTRGAALGTFLTLEAISALYWAPISVASGDWSDAN